MKKIKKIFLIILILINISALSFAHPGRTDSNGGHYNRKTGEYHYHDGRYAGQSQSTTIEEDDNENTTSWEEYKQQKNLSSNKYRESDDVYLQNKTVNTNTIKSSEKHDIDFWSILLGLFVVVVYVIPIGFSIIIFFIELIKDIYAKIKNKKQNYNNLPQTPHIYSNDYKITSVSNEKEELKPIIKQNPYICPKCGGQLQLKNGKYGKFIGCKNYPNCKYTKSLKK